MPLNLYPTFCSYIKMSCELYSVRILFPLYWPAVFIVFYFQLELLWKEHTSGRQESYIHWWGHHHVNNVFLFSLKSMFTLKKYHFESHNVTLHTLNGIILNTSTGHSHTIYCKWAMAWFGQVMHVINITQYVYLCIITKYIFTLE